MAPHIQAWQAKSRHARTFCMGKVQAVLFHMPLRGAGPAPEADHSQQIGHHAGADEDIGDVIDEEAGGIKAKVNKVGYRSKQQPIDKIPNRPS